jgi:hypothetical protein
MQSLSNSIVHIANTLSSHPVYTSMTGLLAGLAIGQYWKITHLRSTNEKTKNLEETISELNRKLSTATSQIETFSKNSFHHSVEMNCEEVCIQELPPEAFYTCSMNEKPCLITVLGIPADQKIRLEAKSTGTNLTTLYLDQIVVSTIRGSAEFIQINLKNWAEKKNVPKALDVYVYFSKGQRPSKHYLPVSNITTSPEADELYCRLEKHFLAAQKRFAELPKSYT